MQEKKEIILVCFLYLFKIISSKSGLKTVLFSCYHVQCLSQVLFYLFAHLFMYSLNLIFIILKINFN